MKRAAARDRASPAARAHHAARLAESPSAVVFAAYQQAPADRSTAQLNLDRTVVHAAGNGFVANLTLDVAQYASVGTKVMALIDSDSYRVTGYFEETKIPVVKPSGHVDIYPISGGQPLRGHVESISRGITDRDNPTGAELLANANPAFELGAARPADPDAHSYR